LFLFDFVLYSIPEDVTRTSVILDGSTYQRLSQAARSRPKLIREQEIVESKRNRDTIEVDRLFYSNEKSFVFHF
jgi:hypothetical protein